MEDHAINVPGMLLLVDTSNGWNGLFDWPEILLGEFVMANGQNDEGSVLPYGGLPVPMGPGHILHI